MYKCHCKEKKLKKRIRRRRKDHDDHNDNKDKRTIQILGAAVIIVVIAAAAATFQGVHGGCALTKMTVLIQKVSLYIMLILQTY